MRNALAIFVLILFSSCSSLQFQLATLNHASVHRTLNPQFNYVLPTTVYTWDTFTYNRFNPNNSFFYSWNYPLNWDYPNNNRYSYNRIRITRPNRTVRNTPTRPQYRQPRVEYTPPKRQPVRTRTMNTQPKIRRRPTQTRPQTRVSTSSTRRGKNNRKQ